MLDYTFLSNFFTQETEAWLHILTQCGDDLRYSRCSFSPCKDRAFQFWNVTRVGQFL